jgi:hypothetical protein
MRSRLGQDLFESLYRDHQVACAQTGGIRYPSHISKTMDEVDGVVEAIAQVV